MIIMSVDVGTNRTGVACCDKNEFLASPVCVINETNLRKCVNKVAEIAKERKVEEIVVGLPKNMQNEVTEWTEKCQFFAEELAKRVTCNVRLWDERFTTSAAIGYLNVTNTRGKKRKDAVDALAATIILENYLDFRKNQATP